MRAAVPDLPISISMIIGGLVRQGTSCFRAADMVLLQHRVEIDQKGQFQRRKSAEWASMWVMTRIISIDLIGFTRSYRIGSNLE